MPRTTVLADRCWTGTGEHPTGPVAVTVEDGVGVTVEHTTSPPSSGEVIALGDRTPLPGLIDCHVHLVDSHTDLQPAAYQALKSVPALRTLLDAGFTAVRDLGSATDPINASLKRAVHDGVLAGPRMLVAPNIISTSGGHGDKMPWLTQRLGIPIGQLAHDTAALRRCVWDQARCGADWIKFTAGGGFSSPVDDPEHVAFTTEEMSVIVRTAADLGLPCAAHAFGDEAVLRALAAGVRSVEHAQLASQATLDRIGEHGAHLVPTLHVPDHLLARLDDDGCWDEADAPTRAKFRLHADRLREFPARLAATTTPIAFGTDAGVIPYDQTWREFPALVRAGLTPLRALRAATTVAADLLGRSDLGRLAPGATADLIAVHGDPFTDVNAMGHVEFVMKAGLVHTPATPRPRRTACKARHC